MVSFKGNLLIVDDTPDNLRFLSKLLTQQGYVVRKALNGARALASVQAEPPELILLDINMPDMDGYEVCQHLKVSHPKIPVIFLSALDQVIDKVTAFQVGGVDYITKPFQLEEVLVRIENQLNLSRLQNQLREKNRQLQQEIRERKRIEKELQASRLALGKANQELYHLATLDALTGVANRRHFDQDLAQEWQRFAREKQPLSLILCDVDFFKHYNDYYGHQAGDECLQVVAQAMSDTLQRPADLFARYGGEEFAVILPNTHAEGARQIAEKLRESVQQLRIPHAQSKVSEYITVSMGVTSQIPTANLSPKALIDLADEALYEAKKQGRDRIILKTLVLP